MPIIKQAGKKLRHDRKLTLTNDIKLEKLKKQIKITRKSPTAKNLAVTYKLLDKAAKTHLVHKNKSSRLKSRLAKLIKPKATKSA